MNARSDVDSELQSIGDGVAKTFGREREVEVFVVDMEAVEVEDRQGNRASG